MKLVLPKAPGLNLHAVWDSGDDCLSPPGQVRKQEMPLQKLSWPPRGLAPSLGSISGYHPRCTVFRAFINQWRLCSAVLFVR